MRPWLRLVPWRVAFLVGAPRFVIRHLFGAPKELVREVQRVARECGRACLAARLESVLALREVAVDGIECPVLYLRGARDRLVPKSSVAAVVKAIPKVIVKEIDAPHLVLQARPREAWAAMRDLLTPSSSARTSSCPH